MRKKIKMSFEALERELSILSPISMLSVLGGTGSPLPNGFCHFNTISSLLFGNSSFASQVRDDMYNRFGEDAFTTTSYVDNNNVTHYAQSYDANLIDRYLRLAGYEATNVSNPTIAQIQDGLNANSGKVSVHTSSTNANIGNHAYTVIGINTDGTLQVRDDTNNRPSFSISISDVSISFHMSTPVGTTVPPYEFPEITTPYPDDITTPYNPYITTPYSG